MVERDSLWRKVIDHKYDTGRGDWCSGIVKAPYGLVCGNILNKWLE